MNLFDKLSKRLGWFGHDQKVDFPWQQFDFAVATKRGLYLSAPGKLHLVLAGAFYGLTFLDDALIAFQSKRELNTGRLIRISKSGKLTVLIDGLSLGCHQIDVIGQHLYIASTYENSILKVDPDNGSITEAFFPLGPLANGRESENYGHINSIWSDGENIRLICHNQTSKTGKPSEIVVCGMDMSLLSRHTTTAGNAHNIVIDDGRTLICDSANATVSDGSEPIKQLTHFTRGLSLTDDMIVVGESEYALRKDREKIGGWINYLRPDWTSIERQRSPGMVLEIRALFRPDRALSK